MTKSRALIGLDVGEKRIGVAVADGLIRIAVPYDTFDVDGNEYVRIAELAHDESATTLVVGYPRNQSGEATAQSEYVEQVAEHLKAMQFSVVFQDESLTSVLAEQQLQGYKKPYTKADIDKYAAALILQDYLETQA